MFVFWIIITISILGQSVSILEIQKINCENNEATTEESTTTLAKICGEASLQIGESGVDDVGEIQSYELKPVVSSLGPMISKDQLEGMVPHVIKQRSQTITEDTPNLLEYSLNDYSITFPESCGHFFFVAVLKTIGSEGETYSTSSFPIKRICEDEKADGLDLALQVKETGNLAKLTGKGGEKLKASGMKVRVKNVGSNKLEARNLLDSVDVVSIFACVYFTQDEEPMKRNSSFQEFSDKLRREDYNSFQPFISMSNYLVGLKTALIDQQTKLGVELEPGEEVEIDLSDIIFTKGYATSQCFERPFLILNLDPNGKLMDNNKQNNMLFLPMEFESSHFEPSFSNQCEIFPDWKEDGKSALIYREFEPYSYNFNGQTMGFEAVDSFRLGAIRGEEFFKRRQMEILKHFDLCSESPIEDDLSVNIKKSLITQASKVLSKIMAEIEAVTSKGDLATEEKEKLTMIFGLYDALLKGFIDERRNAFRQFAMQALSLGWKLNMFDHMPSHNPTKRNSTRWKSDSMRNLESETDLSFNLGFDMNAGMLKLLGAALFSSNENKRTSNNMRGRSREREWGGMGGRGDMGERGGSGMSEGTWGGGGIGENGMGGDGMGGDGMGGYGMGGGGMNRGGMSGGGMGGGEMFGNGMGGGGMNGGGMGGGGMGGDGMGGGGMNRGGMNGGGMGGGEMFGNGMGGGGMGGRGINGGEIFGDGMSGGRMGGRGMGGGRMNGGGMGGSEMNGGGMSGGGMGGGEMFGFGMGGNGMNGGGMGGGGMNGGGMGGGGMNGDGMDGGGISGGGISGGEIFGDGMGRGGMGGGGIGGGGMGGGGRNGGGKNGGGRNGGGMGGGGMGEGRMGGGGMKRGGMSGGGMGGGEMFGFGMGGDGMNGAVMGGDGMNRGGMNGGGMGGGEMFGDGMGEGGMNGGGMNGGGMDNMGGRGGMGRDQGIDEYDMDDEDMNYMGPNQRRTRFRGGSERDTSQRGSGNSVRDIAFNFFGGLANLGGSGNRGRNRNRNWSRNKRNRTNDVNEDDNRRTRNKNRRDRTKNRSNDDGEEDEAETFDGETFGGYYMNPDADNNNEADRDDRDRRPSKSSNPPVRGTNDNAKRLGVNTKSRGRRVKRGFINTMNITNNAKNETVIHYGNDFIGEVPNTLDDPKHHETVWVANALKSEDQIRNKAKGNRERGRGEDDDDNNDELFADDEDSFWKDYEDYVEKQVKGSVHQMLEEQSRNYNQQFGTSKMYGPTKKFMFPRRQRGPGSPRGHQSRNTRGRGGRPCSMTKNEKAVLKLLTKITNELSMGKTVSSMMKDYNFLYQPFVEKLVTLTTKFKTMNPTLHLMDPWNLFIVSDQMKNGSKFMEFYEIMNKFNMGLANLPRGMEDLKEITVEYLQFLSGDIVEDIKIFLEEEDQKDLVDLVDFSVQIFKIIEKYVDDIMSLISRYMAMSYLNSKELELLTHQAGREPNENEICSRIIGKRMSIIEKLNNKTVEEEEEEPFFNFFDYVKEKANSNPVHWIKYKEGIYRGIRSSLLGVMVWEKIAMCSCPGNPVHGGIGIFPPIKGPFYTDSTQNGINIGSFDGSGGFGGGSDGFNGNGGFGGGGSGSSFGSGGGIIGSNGGFGDNGGFGNGGNNFGMGGNKRSKGMLIEKLKLLIENSDQMILQRKLKEILNEAKESFEDLQGININSLTDEELLRNFWNVITNKNFHVNQIKGIVTYLSTTANSVGELFASLFKNVTNELGEILNKLSLENLQKLAEAFKQNVNKNLFNDISNINKENLQEKLLEVMNSKEFYNLPLSQAQEPLRNLLNGILENSKTIIDKNELTEAIASLKTSGILSANANVQTSGNEELLKKVKEIVQDKKTAVMKLKNILMAFIGQKTALQDLIIKITENVELLNSLLSQIPLEKLKIFTQTVEENSNLEFPEEYKNLNEQDLTNELIEFMETDEFKSAVEDMNVSDLKDILQDLLNGLLQTSSDVLSKTYLKNLLERLQEQGLLKSTLNIKNLDQNQLLNEVKNVIGSSNVSGSLLKQLVEHISKTIGILQDIGGNVFGNSNQELRQKLIERLKQVIETSNGMIIEKKLKALLKGLQKASVIDLDINIEELTNAEVLNSFWEIFEISELSTNKINEIVRFLESPIKTIGEFLSSLFENPSDQINDILSYVSLDNLKQIAEGLKQSLNTDMLGDFSGLNKDQLLNKIKNLMETSEFNNMPLSQSQNPLKNIINGVLQENKELLDKNALNELAVNLQGKGLLSTLNLNNLGTNNLLLKIKEILEKPDTSIQTLEQIFETLVAQKVMLADFLSQTFQDQEQLNNLLSQISVENIKMFAKSIEEKSNLKLPVGYENLEKEELLKKLSKFTQTSQLINKFENMELNDLKEILEKLLSGLMQTTGDSFDVNYLKTILMEVQKENLVSDKIKLNNLNQDQLLAELKKVIQNPNSPGSLLIKLVEKFSRKKALFLADLDAIHENIPQIINHLPLDTLKSFLKYVEVTANLKVKNDVNALSREEIIQKIISSVQLSDYLEGVIKVPMENVKNAFQNLLTGCFEEATKLLGEKGLSQMIKSLQDANVLDLSQSLNKVGENQMISKIKDLISNPETSLGDLKTIFDCLTNFFENKDFLISSITQILESPSLNANEIPTENLKKVVESIQKVSGEQVSNLNKLNNKELRQQIIDLLEKPEVQNLPLSNLEEILGGIVNTIPGSTLNDDTMKIFKTKLEDILSASGIHLTKDATVPDALKKIFESDDLNDNSKIKFIALFKEILENSGKKWPQDLNDLGNTEVMNLLKKVYESSHSDQESSNSNPFQITNLFDKNNALPSIGSALTDLLGKPKTDLNSLFQSNPQMLQNMQQQLQSTGFGLDDVDSNTGFGLEDFGDTSHSVNTLKEIIFPKAQNGFNTLLSKFPNRALGLKRKTEVRSLEDKTDQSSIVRLAAKKEERDGRKIIIRGTVVIEIPGEGIYRSRRNLGSICDDSWGTNEAIVACKQFAKSEPMLKSSEHTLVIAKAIKGDPSMKEYFTNNLKVVPIMLGSVKCSEDAEDIYFDCDHDAWGEHSCMAYARTAIECHYEKGILEFLR